MKKWLFFLGLFFCLLIPALDPDLGWHLRCGQIILNKQGLCLQNQFSSLLPNYRWINHYWLYQIILFFIWKKAGLWGLSILNAIITTSIFIIFYLTIKNYRMEKRMAIILTLILSWGIFSLGIRSQLLGILYFSLILFLLFKEKPVYIPLVFLIWANTHASVVLGLAFIFLFLLKNFNKNSLLLFFFSFLATLINPLGLKIFPEAWRHFSVVHLDKLIAEWVPPQLLIRLAVFLGGIFIATLSPKGFWPLIASFAILGLKARRNLPFFFILFFVLLLENIAFKNWLSRWLKRKEIRENCSLFISLVILFWGLLVRLPQTIKTNSSWHHYCQNSTLPYPCQAVKFLKNQKAQGNLFNRYEWGGFLIWQLPKNQVFVDGRMPAWKTDSGKSPYTIYLETLQTQPGWQKTLDDYKINWILISPDTFMDLKLRPNPKSFGWQEAYRSNISVVYKKADR